MDDRIEETNREHAFLTGGDEVSRLIAQFNWATTILGPLARWPGTVKGAVALILRSPLPIVTLWGEPGVMIYNDAYAVFAGSRHPQALGANVREAWPEVAEFNDHVIKRVFREGGTLSYSDQELTLFRNGRSEKAWLNLDYSPIVDDVGAPIGVIAIVVETTDKVLSDRRMSDERKRLEQIYEQAPSFMALLEGPDHRFSFVNPAYRRLVDGRDVIGKTVAEALPEAADQGYIGLLDQVFRSGEPFFATGAKFDIPSKRDGLLLQRHVDFVYQPMVGPHGVTGIFVEGTDVSDRVLAQARERASETQFQTFAQTMPNHVWTAAPDGQVDWFNERVFEYSGKAAAQLVGDKWGSIVHPDDIGDAAERWSQAVAAGEAYETEFRIRRHDEIYRWHLVRAVPIRSEDGTIVRWIGTNTDIQDRKLAETATANDRNRLWDLSQDLMLICDFGGVITAVSPSAKRLLDWNPEEMIGRAIAEFLHPDDLPATAAELGGLSQGLPTLAFENRYRTKQGSYRLLAWTAVPGDGLVHAVGRDVTEERALARDRERIWTLSPVLKVVSNSSGELTAINPAWTRALGWTAAESLGRPSADFMAPEEREAWPDRVRQLAAGATLPKYRTVLLAKDGERRQVEWTTVPEDGSFYGFGRDITAEVEAAQSLAAIEAALRQSQKMEAVGQLTGGIAHDFNNLLQGVTGNLEILGHRLAQGRTGELERFLSGATNAATRAAALTHRLLAFARRQPLDPRPVRANPLLASMEDLLRRTMGEHVELELVLAGGLWLTHCDANQLENAVLNLVINARDAMPDGGKLTIETGNAHLDRAYAARQRDVQPGQYVCISVTDTGVGMSEDTIAKAFEPFFTTKPIGQGTGLGLSMIYGFAKQSEGSAKIYSEAGVGTTLKLYLPRYRGKEEPHEDPPASIEAHRTDAGEVVLVVEDEPVVRGLIVEALNELGYQAIEAADGQKGVEILRSPQRIDLLITDFGLPGLNGRQVAEAGRLSRPRLKVLFITGYAENAALASGLLEPGMTMITKPFAMNALAARIRSIIET